MKKFCALGIAIGLVCFVSCEKQQTEAEKNAEIERQVQQRLAAERQADEDQKLAQREAELKAREEALAQKEQEPESAPTATPQMRGSDVQQREVTEADSGEPASYDTFYTKLEPYGAWLETSDYGYVWQPNDVGRSGNWRPYTNGHWVYTDAGWTWNSDEPFGWATYHYGRWARLRSVGWVWIPGDEWAPAWVSWRTGDDYVGWAPLPPEARFERGRGIHNRADNDYDIGPDQYCFVPATDLGVQQIERTIVPVERNVTIVTQTINVTNITYNNTTIVNQGPNFEELRRRSRHPIQQLRLERRARFDNANPHAVVRGEVLEMPAPAIAPARPADRPRKVKEKIAKPVVEHGWNDIRDKKAAEHARAKMKAETGAPSPKATQAQSQQTPASAQPAETPVRNLPDRAKKKPNAVGAMSPGVKATPLASPSRPEERTKDQVRQKNEAERAQKEKVRADEKNAQQQKMEEQRRTKATRNKPQAPSPAASSPPRVTPAVKPTPTATEAEPSPPISPTPQKTTPYAKELPERAPTNSAKKLERSRAAAPQVVREKKTEDKDRRRDKGNRENPSPSPR